MLEAKDIAKGCLIVTIGLALIPLFVLVFRLIRVIAIPLSIVIAIILGLTCIGRIFYR